MKIGQKVTVLNRDIAPLNMPKFLRGYIVRITETMVVLYDPIRDWTWGWQHHNIKRVMSA
jgi:hypothetical protein